MTDEPEVTAEEVLELRARYARLESVDGLIRDWRATPEEERKRIIAAIARSAHASDMPAAVTAVSLLRTAAKGAP